MSKNEYEFKTQDEIMLEIEYFRDVFNLINSSIVESLEFSLGLQKNIDSLNIDEVGAFIESVNKVKNFNDERVLPLVLEYDNCSIDFKLESSENIDELERFQVLFSQVHSEILIIFNQMQIERKKMSKSETTIPEELLMGEENSKVSIEEKSSDQKEVNRVISSKSIQSSDKFNDIHEIGTEVSELTTKYFADSIDLVKDIKQKYRVELNGLRLKILIVEIIFGIVVAVIFYKDFVIITIGNLLMLIWINLVLSKKNSSIVALCEVYLTKYRNVN